jgi:Transcriptional regulator, AbiEi antitoxin
MFSDRPPQLSELAESQRGILTASQLAGGGLSRELARSRVRQGRWQRVHRGVYATFSGEPSRESVLWAAVLSAGPGAMLSYRSAAEVDKLADEPSELVHVTIPAQRRVSKAAGLVIHVSARAGQAVHPARTPPRTRIDETILDLAEASASLDEVIGWVSRGLGRRLTKPDQLRAAMNLRSAMHWRRDLSEMLSPEMQGVLSPLEHRYVRDVERPHGLPSAVRQARTGQNGHRQYRDALYEQFLLAVELDGSLAHPAETRWRDIRRDNAAALDGITTLRYGWIDVAVRPCLVAAEVARILTERGYTRCRPCSPSCPVRLVAASTSS